MNDIKKIVYFLDFSDYIGGSNKVLLTQAYIMKQRGYQVKMVIPRQEDRVPIEECNEICRRYGLETLCVNYSISVCMENIDILKALRDYKVIAKLLKEDRPDLIHSAQLNIAAEFAARDLRIPHLMNIYPVDRETFNLNWMKIYPMYHSADSLLFSKRWGEGLGIPSRCIRVAYDKDTDNRKPINVQNYETTNIVSIGVFCEYKNQLEMLKFILQCKRNKKNVKMIFLGLNNNAYGEECREFVNKHGLEELVKFEGFVLNIEDYLQEADLFILASTVESYPGVIVESMANKVPIISTPVAGVPELLVDGENGFLTEGHEAKYIYEAFLRYLGFRGNGQIAQIVENAYITYLENHTYMAVGNQLDDYYQWIVEDYCRKNSVYLTADQIEQRFQDIFINSNLSETNLESKSLIWFLYHAFSKIEQKENKKIAIWGAGFWGSRVLEWIYAFGKGTEFVGFIDTNKSGEYLGYPILQKNAGVVEECGTIFIAVENRKAIREIMNYLKRNGKRRNQDFFLACNSPIVCN